MTLMSMTPAPADDRVKIVHSFQELISTPFANGVNALCWERVLPGGFQEVVAGLGGGENEGIVGLTEEVLHGLSVSAEGRAAIDFMREDLRLLREHGLAPELNRINAYPRDEEGGPVVTDVFSFHADSAPVEADTWLCTYFGPPSEGLRNEEARRRVDIPETRAELLALFGGEDDDGFLEFLSDHCFDLHYAPVPGASPYSFGMGNLWRIAVDYPDSPVPPCIHRAPDTVPGMPARLLLIS